MIDLKNKFVILKVADVRFELAVALTDPNVPVYYNRKEAEDFVQYNFRSFFPLVPNYDVFEVPDECKEPGDQN